MKPIMLSRKNASHLFDHVLDGFRSSHEGLMRLRELDLIGEREFAELVERNSQRLIARIKEFKLLNGMLSIGFAILFTWMQVSGDDVDARRTSRTRVRRRTETEQTK